MRVLLTNHVPLDDPAAGACSADLALRLRSAGCDVRALVVAPVASPGVGGSAESDATTGSSARGGSASAAVVPVRRIVSSATAAAADLDFDPPRFTIDVGDGPRFADLKDPQLDAYREVLRRVLDEEVAAFDPQVIHCGHIWLFGHLALESGVPYVLSGAAAELDEFDVDARYRRLATEAAENAGRVIVADDDLAERVQARFGDLEGRLIVAPLARPPAPRGAEALDAAWLTSLYRQVVDERLGPRAD